jgi:folate-binding protein YgfZ
VATDVSLELDAEYRQLRDGAGFVRRASWRVLEVRGSDAVEFLESQLTNDIASLPPGGGCYAALLDRKGHLQSDLRVLLVDPERTWLVAEAEGAERLRAHLAMYRVGRAVEVEPIDLLALSVIGPASAQAIGIQSPAGEHAHRPVAVGGVADARAIATDRGFDLLLPAAAEASVAAAFEAAGVPEVGEETAEVVRVESGYPRLGREMTTETMPAEAGIIERAVSFAKGCYIGQETVARLHYKGKPNRHLRGLRLGAPVAAGDPIRLGDREVGTIGTAVVSPAHGPIALAILRREAEPGETVFVGAPGIAAEVAEVPFAAPADDA